MGAAAIATVVELCCKVTTAGFFLTCCGTHLQLFLVEGCKCIHSCSSHDKCDGSRPYVSSRLLTSPSWFSCSCAAFAVAVLSVVACCVAQSIHAPTCAAIEALFSKSALVPDNSEQRGGGAS